MNIVMVALLALDAGVDASMGVHLRAMALCTIRWLQLCCMWSYLQQQTRQWHFGKIQPIGGFIRRSSAVFCWNIFVTFVCGYRLLEAFATGWAPEGCFVEGVLFQRISNNMFPLVTLHCTFRFWQADVSIPFDSPSANVILFRRACSRPWLHARAWIPVLILVLCLFMIPLVGAFSRPWNAPVLLDFAASFLHRSCICMTFAFFLLVVYDLRSLDLPTRERQHLGSSRQNTHFYWSQPGHVVWHDLMYAFMFLAVASGKTLLSTFCGWPVVPWTMLAFVSHLLPAAVSWKVLF